MNRKLLLVAVVLLVSLAALFTSVYASDYQGAVVFSCTNADAAGTGAHVLDRDNTGSGNESLRVDITDGAGTLIYTLSFSNVLGSFGGGIGDFFYTTAPQYNPITFTLTSLAGNGLPEQVDVVAQGNCDGLPFLNPPGGCIPYNGVMGEIPYSTQAYFEPGKQANGVTVNAGTYMVLGTDESGEYYRIIIACDYIWVPAGAVQPSFQPPWNGQPLPTEVVS